MRTPLPRRLTARPLLLLALVVPALTACGFHAQTDAVYQAADGPNNRAGQVYILNATVISAKDGMGTFAGTLVNQSQTQPDTLVSVSGASGGAGVRIAPNQSVNLATSGKIRLSSADIKPGDFIPLTFQFASGQTTQMNVPVYQNTGIFSGVPVGAPSPTATATATGSPTATPQPKHKSHAKKPSPSGSPSPSATPTSQ